MPNVFQRLKLWVEATRRERLIRRQQACPHTQLEYGVFNYCARCGVRVLYGEAIGFGDDYRRWSPYHPLFDRPLHFVRLRTWFREFKARRAKQKLERRQSACNHDWVEPPSVRNYSFGPSENYPEGREYFNRPAKCRKCGMSRS